MSKEILRCSSLSKLYRQGSEQLKILNDINFSVAQAQRVAIVGSSGSGKSTLLSLLGGLDQPTSGEIYINGELISKLPDTELSKLRNQELGFVYQFHHLLPEFSALENVAMPFLIHSGKRKQALAKAAHWLKQVGLSDRADHLPSELSGGERQRVAIARALVNEPSCVLMDEPTGALDNDTSSKIMQLIDEVSALTSAAFIIVTHDMQVASSMQDIYRLDNGNLSREGLSANV